MRLFPDRQPRLRLVLILALSSSGGAISALFLARLLAEGGAASWAWQPLPVAGLALLAALAVPVAILGPVFYVSAQGKPVPPGELLVAPLLALFLPAFYLVRGIADLLQARVLLGGALAAGLLLAGGGTALLPATPARRRVARFATLALLALPLLVYLLTLSPTVGEGDSLELQAAAGALGVGHPPGYPLYTLLGHLFVFLPAGDAAYRVNLVSAVFAGLAVAFLYLTVVGLTGQRAAALLAALAFAFSPAFWTQAVIAGVHALGAFFVALLLYLVVARDRARGGGWRLPALLYGLSLTNQLTMMLLAPALALSVLLRRGLIVLGRWRQWLVAAGLALVGLLPYLYIPLRRPALGLRGALAWIGSGWSEALRPGNALHDAARYGFVGRLALAQYGRVGAALALAGLAWLLWRQRRAGLCLLLAWVAYALWAARYPVADTSAFLIPAYLVMAVGIGAAVAALAGWLAARARPLVAPLTLLMALLPLGLASAHWPAVDRGQSGWQRLAWGRYVLGLDIPRGASILGDGGEAGLLQYLQAVEGLRPDLAITAVEGEAGYRRGLEAGIAAGTPVYLVGYVPGLAGRFHLRSLGPLVEVGTAPMAALGAVDYTLDITFGECVHLLGLNAERLTLARGDTARVTLFWRAEPALPADYHVRLRLVGASGHIWWEESDHPVSGMYPTMAWRGAEVVPDYHAIPIDLSLHPGDYRLEVGLFPPFGNEGLPVAGQEEPFLSLAGVRVLDGVAEAAPALAIAQPMAASFDGLALVGRDVPTAARPGAQLPVTLYWRAAGPCPDYLIVVEALDETGRIVASASGPPLYGEYPTSRWAPGVTVVTRHRLALPANGGTLRLRVRLREPDAGQFVPVQPGWLAPRGEACPLGSVRVEGSPSAAEGTY